MSEKPRGSGCVTATVVAAILLPLLYVLSMGPAIWLEQHGYLPGRMFVVAYDPLFYLAVKIEWFRAALDWYIGLWVP